MFPRIFIFLNIIQLGTNIKEVITEAFVYTKQWDGIHAISAENDFLLVRRLTRSTRSTPLRHTASIATLLTFPLQLISTTGFKFPPRADVTSDGAIQVSSCPLLQMSGKYLYRGKNQI